MDPRMNRELRALRVYAGAATVLIALLGLGGFSRRDQRPRFEEIDVERINVVEKDGSVRLVISNEARMPDAIIGGKSYPRTVGRRAGMIFFNEEGDENGGLIYSGRRDSNATYHAEAGLLFDQYQQDQVIGMTYDDDNGRRRAGLQVWDRANVPLGELIAPLEAIGNMPPGPARAQAFAALQAKYQVESFVSPRVFVGRTV